jgi:GNAT superfamily N-acetyltransferase
MSTNLPLISVRAATPADVEPLYPIHRDAMRPSVEATWGPWDETYQQERFGKHFDFAHRQVVEVDGVPAGFWDVVDYDDYTWLAELVLAPAFQRRGLGSGLIGGLLTTCGAKGIPLRLQVLKANSDARRLYERLGFVETGQTEFHFQMEAQPALP